MNKEINFNKEKLNQFTVLINDEIAIKNSITLIQHITSRIILETFNQMSSNKKIILDIVKYKNYVNNIKISVD